MGTPEERDDTALAGLFGALALFLPTATGHLIPGGVIWLIPWQLYDDQLGWLPGPLTGYPSAGTRCCWAASPSWPRSWRWC